MVTFNKDSFTITVPTAGEPMCNWLSTHEDLVQLLTCIDRDMASGRNFYYAITLIEQMMPDWETAIKMINK